MLFLFFLLPFRGPKKWTEKNRRCFFKPLFQGSPKTFEKVNDVNQFLSRGAKHDEEIIYCMKLNVSSIGVEMG